MSDDFKYNPLTSDMDLVGDGRGGGEVPAVQSEVTYAQLVALRNSGKLAPGTWYRIIDYQCTTTQVNTQSAGHLFDVIVRADSNDTINENAFAAHHGRTGYFENSKLAAWRLKYCLDNDTSRFAWADEENGRGVVYYMQDEFGNECPYDFKNIMFRRWQVTAFDRYPDLVSEEAYFGAYKINGTEKTLPGASYGLDEFLYTFTIDNTNDGSLIPQVCGNKIAPHFKDSQMLLNNNVIELASNSLCYGNIFGNSCVNNTFGTADCKNNILHNDCHCNTFFSASYNILGTGCGDNIISGNFNDFDDLCDTNVLKPGCSRITLRDHCYDNTIGASCTNITFAQGCYNNTIGASCTNITFAQGCYGNSFDRAVRFVQFLQRCGGNSFRNNCEKIVFSENCTFIIFGNYIQNVAVGNGVSYCRVAAGTSSAYVQNAEILPGTCGESTTKRLDIAFAPNKPYTQVAGLDSNGDLRIWIPADLARDSGQASAVAVPGTSDEYNLVL